SGGPARRPLSRRDRVFERVEHPSEGKMLTMAIPAMFSSTPGNSFRLPPPRLCEHTRGCSASSATRPPRSMRLPLSSRWQSLAEILGNKGDAKQVGGLAPRRSFSIRDQLGLWLTRFGDDNLLASRGTMDELR